MKNLEITINGEVFPCRSTMGALLRFKQETGKEVSEIKGDALSDICTYLWCCVKSASKKDGKDFNLSLMDFADSIDEETLLAWMSLQNGDEEKKREGKTVKG